MILLFSHVRTGRWASVMPAKLAETLGLTDTLRAIPIVEPEAEQTIGLVVPQREPMMPITAALVAEAERVAKGLERVGRIVTAPLMRRSQFHGTFQTLRKRLGISLPIVENVQTSFADIEAALSLGFRPRRFELLRRVTDLFIANVETCTDSQVNIFDEIMEKLVERIERESLIELSERLAPLPRAPINISQRLSRDDDIRDRAADA